MTSIEGDVSPDPESWNSKMETSKSGTGLYELILKTSDTKEGKTFSEEIRFKFDGSEYDRQDRFSRTTH